MSMRYTQPKAEAQRHTEILKAMLKQPQNKLCADCKRNDPRWASTNLGCFMCIRCSGIHRGMGVHITRIKSVDLDTWTPEQIVQIQRWGNTRANAYWEAHLKAGHAPPEHKMESFIRSKYESKRWAMEGPIPEPETLDIASSVSPSSTTSVPPPTAPSTRSAPSAIDLLAGPTTSRSQPSKPQLAKATPALPTAVAVQSSAGGGLFDLDFNEPAKAPTPPIKRDAKADILSLFASSPPPPPSNQVRNGSASSTSGLNQGMNGMNLGSKSFGNDPWSTTSSPVAPNINNQFGGFSDFENPPTTNNSNNSIGGANPWGAPSSNAPDPFGEFTNSNNSNGLSGGGGKKVDEFSDIWS